MHKNGRKTHSAQRRGRDPTTVAIREITLVNRQARIFRRALDTTAVLSTSAGGFLGVQNVAASANVTSAVNWSSYEAIALEYRVLAVQIEIFPIVNAQTSPTTPAPTMYAICAYSSDDVPTTYGQVAQGPGALVRNGYRPTKFGASSKDFPNAKLWAPVTGAVPAANIFGIVLADPGSIPASTASTAYFRVTIKYLVEFRSLD
jgi:hypothetical protein